MKFTLLLIGTDEDPNTTSINLEAESFEEVGKKIDALDVTIRSGSIIYIDKK